MVKHLITLLFLICPYTHSQIDSLLQDRKIQSADSIITNISDTVSAADTSITSVKVETPDTLTPIQGEPLSGVSSIISRKEFLFTNYRYTGDLLRSFPLNFIKDQGFVGQPNETFIYGVGNNAISYLQDGILINNRYTNSLDLNLVQSEDIDSIEIVPSPRGFLYGPYNNPVTVNFITRDFISPEPYTRIRYYEGYYGEAMIDGKFNAKIFKRWNFGFQLTNRKFDSTYTNSEFSIWQINSKLKYFLSNSVNISAYYGYVDSRVGLNGGVDVDSISRITDDINSILYEPLRAPVVSPYQKLETLQHNFVLRTLAKPFDNSKLDLSFYYRYNLDELVRLQQSSTLSENVQMKTYGSQLYYDQGISIFRFQLLSVYDKSKIERDRQFSWDSSGSIKYYDKNSISGSVILSADILDNLFIPSVFYKYSDVEFSTPIPLQQKLNGFGTDLMVNLTNNMFLYGGYSVYEQMIHDDELAKSLESGLNIKLNGLTMQARIFKREGLFLPFEFIPPGPEQHYYITGNLSGVGLNLNYSFWKILIETNSSYYYDGMTRYWNEVNQTIKDEVLNIPEIQFKAGIYVNGDFFESNLYLKTGLTFYYYGEINSSPYWPTVIATDPTNKLDFTLAGEIKKLAIFYFIWENIFDKQYYITPYYPMPESNLRFGLAWELFN